MTLYDIDATGSISNPRDLGFTGGLDRELCPAIGDVDNDGVTELVVFESVEPGVITEQLMMYDVDSFGTLNDPIGMNFDSSDGRLVSIAVGDLDNDGFNELIAGQSRTSSGVNVMGMILVSPMGTRGQWIISDDLADSDGRIYDIAVGDVDNDGVNELVVAHSFINGTRDATICIYTSDEAMNLTIKAQIGEVLIDKRLTVSMGDLPAVPGDANGDGKVTDADAAILATNWQMQEGATWGDGDFNEDGKVTDADAAILATHWGYGTGKAVNVPEPSIFLMLSGLLCGAGMLLYRRRR